MRLTDMTNSSLMPQFIEEISNKVAEEKEKYILETLCRLDIDPDILINQMQEIRRLNDILEGYKDLEEQGLLLRLPCKVGDKYYRIRKTCSESWLEPKGKHFPSSHYCEDFCPRYHNRCDGEYIVVEYVFETIGQIISNQKWLGEYLFLTREEAEQKLKEMEG